ncbi:TIP49-domain-containing protein [Armillaria gallica]|uniref:RuvB-like helicase n=1 Tax=Armillaria gallica TaxID=47427 RepID=A0A2H3E1I4_ARMGA|nr:TIP49-domain-containing protein [Armillaria gallica]
MVQEDRTAGQTMLCVGPPSTGKTTIALDMAQTLGDIPFTMIAASEVFSLLISKAEAFRWSIGIRIKKATELVEIQTNRSLTGLSLSKTIYGKMIDVLSKEKVLAGDVITIDKTSGRITKFGRLFARPSRGYDAMGADINARKAFLVLFAGDTGEIKPEVRNQINAKVAKWREKGKVEIIPGLQTREDMEQMIQLRCQEEDVSFIADVTGVLTSATTQTTLRYSLNPISCTQILAWKRKAKQVGVEDPRKAYMYFVDEKRIVQDLKKQRRSLDNSPSRSRLGQ